MAARARASVSRRSWLRRVELFGEGAGAGGVAGEEELDDVGGDVHAAGGVDAGGEAEADLGGGGWLVERELGELHEGAQAGLDGVGERGEAEGGDGAVFAGEGDGVGDGGDGDELEEGGEEDAVGAGLEGCGVGGERRGGEEQGVGEFEGDGGAAEVLVGVGAAGLGGVDDGEAVGECAVAGVGEVVVGDDEVEARGRGLRRLRRRRGCRCRRR